MRFTEQLVNGIITGHKCPQRGLVHVPPKNFCPICVVTTDECNEVQVADEGTVTCSVLTPIQYYGQQEREEYAVASILLDGADGTVGSSVSPTCPSAWRSSRARTPRRARGLHGETGPAVQRSLS